MLALLLVAAFIRIFYISAAGYERDIELFKIWSETATLHGITNIYEKTWCDYNPGFLYVLNVIGHIYQYFSPSFERDTYLFQFLIKLPSILADLAITALIFLQLRNKLGSKPALLSAAFFAFNPAIILNSAYWGQVDTVPTLIALLAIIALKEDHFRLSVALITTAILTKTQMVMLLPIILFVTYKRRGLVELASCLVVAWLSYVIIIFPFFIDGKAHIVVEKLLGAVGAYPFLSLNAYNFWWLISGGTARDVLDTGYFYGLLSYKSIGLIMLGLLFALLIHHLNKKPLSEKKIYLCCALAFFGFFMLPTQMHERYILPALPFLLLASSESKSLKVVYALLSASIFFNLFVVLARTYPDNYPGLSALWLDSQIDIVISVVNVLLFSYLTYTMGKEVGGRQILVIAFAMIFLISATLVIRPHKPVLLSDTSPHYTSQQWGKMQVNKSVTGARLSVNGHVFRRGIGTHANSYIDYHIDSRFRYLEGYVGISYSSNVGNKMRFDILGDQQLLFSTGILQGVINPIYFKVSVDNIDTIRLVANDGGDGINNDHGNWLQMTLIP
ncbi:MAG: NPCBM/NEW2 domain-containing protein [Halioglobus sp.]